MIQKSSKSLAKWFPTVPSLNKKRKCTDKSYFLCRTANKLFPNGNRILMPNWHCGKPKKKKQTNKFTYKQLRQVCKQPLQRPGLRTFHREALLFCPSSFCLCNNWKRKKNKGKVKLFFPKMTTANQSVSLIHFLKNEGPIICGSWYCITWYQTTPLRNAANASRCKLLYKHQHKNTEISCGYIMYGTS